MVLMVTDSVIMFTACGDTVIILTASDDDDDSGSDDGWVSSGYPSACHPHCQHCCVCFNRETSARSLSMIIYHTCCS